MSSQELSVEISTKPAEAVSAIPCAICRRQFSKYTCPGCNVPYCSLTCFRSEAHAECSESFYRKEIESDVRSAPSKTAEERQKMMELLKHFEEDSMDDSVLGALQGEEDEDGGTDLAERVGGLDLDSASYDELWAALTPEERGKFSKALSDPNSELAKQLLTSEELKQELIEPWWESPSDAELNESKPTAASRNLQKRKYGKLPDIIEVPPSIISTSQSPGKVPLLLYNLCAICITYAYLNRYFSTSPLSMMAPNSPERAEARRLVAQLIPFLIDRKSQLVHPTLSSVVTDLWSRFTPGEMTPAFFALLLRDSSTLLRPSTVVELGDAIQGSSSNALGGSVSRDLEGHPNANTLRALSDLSTLFSGPTHSSSSASSASSSAPLRVATKPIAATNKHIHVAHKLTFYAAHVLSVPPLLLRALADETARRADVVAREGLDVQSGSTSTQRSAGVLPGDGAQAVGQGGAGRVRIEELT
ncbi:uncharacterized protein LAESUDRAFT_724932 [Laetiporus sulphureus 93-53]|uniref:HIT-type domain-containing protein n=1 Tax=Laetiporus sulphureus 93-53 TaxID=1314785 RepID=A0A165EPB4_9APHY|nr:uncharacterized protein LAESUDRAFT_724932 [Laetiporus sulphureus 93-53]KZT07481.1 hypothetical protein LAESUDRAFT_724932 [Laetiporus sulphureus 93-53]